MPRPLCQGRTSITVRQPKSLEDREIGKTICALVESLGRKVLFPEGDDTGTSIVLALNIRSQVLSFKNHRNGVEKPVFKLAPFETDRCLLLLLLICAFPGIPDDVLQQVISQASHLAQNRTAYV